jgi:hypothetical protein
LSLSHNLSVFSAQSRAARDTQEKGKREKKKGKRGEKLKIFVASVVAGSSSTAQAPQGLLPGTPKAPPVAQLW